MPNCRKCKYRKARLRCLICEQKDELRKTKYRDRQYSEIVYRNDRVFPQLALKQRAIWVLYLAKFTEEEIAQIVKKEIHKKAYSQSVISRYLSRIKRKLKVKKGIFHIQVTP